MKFDAGEPTADGLASPQREERLEPLEAYQLIARHGAVFVNHHNACEEIQLTNGDVLNFWFPSEWAERSWTIERAA